MLLQEAIDGFLLYLKLVRRFIQGQFTKEIWNLERFTEKSLV